MKTLGWAIQSGEQFIAMDYQSGGYPYSTEKPENSAGGTGLWVNFEAAESYLVVLKRSFSRDYPEPEVVEILYEVKKAEKKKWVIQSEDAPQFYLGKNFEGEVQWDTQYHEWEWIEKEARDVLARIQPSYPARLREVKNGEV